MDFARKHMEKYGWTDGKGLGKHENGISEALKPKLKRSVTGVGHDAASDFTEHWWSTLYDRAAGNLEVKEKNGKTKKIKTKDDKEFEITNSTWRLKKKRKADDIEEQYQDFFVRTSVLTNGGSRTENVRDAESDEDMEKNDVMKLTDEELFAACEGRTAHKGARHGLKALGKLARIAQQEALLLSQPQYKGYSHAKNIQKNREAVVEEINLSPQCDATTIKKKKKKKKHCSSGNMENSNIDEAESTQLVPMSDNEMMVDVADVVNDEKIGRKIKKCKKNKELEFDESNDQGKSDNKKKRQMEPIIDMENLILTPKDQVKKKKKKESKE